MKFFAHNFPTLSFRRKPESKRLGPGLRIAGATICLRQGDGKKQLLGEVLFSALVLVLGIVGFAGAADSRAQDLPPSHILDLNCISALAAVGEQELAGIFAYVPDADTSAAFADLLVHNRKALRKFLAKDEKDMKDVGGVSQWDHDAAAYALAIYALPAATTVDKPSDSDSTRLRAVAAAPKMTLEDITAHRSVKR